MDTEMDLFAFFEMHIYLDKNNWLKSLYFINFEFLDLLWKNKVSIDIWVYILCIFSFFHLSTFLILFQYPAVFITGILFTQGWHHKEGEKK